MTLMRSGRRVSSQERRLPLTQTVMRAATRSERGFPHVAPLLFAMGGRVYFEADEWGLKVRHIVRNGKVALFDEYGSVRYRVRHRGALMRGTGRIVKLRGSKFMSQTTFLGKMQVGFEGFPSQGMNRKN